MRACLALPLLAFAGLARGALCTPDAVPAATVLLPYLEACRAPCFAFETETRVVVANLGAAPRLARVTLWSYAAVPVLDLDLYLQGFAQQEFSLDALLRSGTRPVSGAGVSEPGAQADPEIAFPGCNAGSDPGGGAPVYAPLDAGARAALVAALQGEADPQTGLCSAVRRPGNAPVAAYATVDAVDRCNAPRAGTPGFAAALVDANVLSAHVVMTRAADNFETVLAGVPIEAAGGGQLDAERTFYRFDGVGGDRREPLPASWVLHRRHGGVFSDTSLLVAWRAPGTLTSPFDCETGPAWYPLGHGGSGWSSKGVFAIADDGTPQRLRVGGEFGLATQRVSLRREREPEEPLQGAVYLDLRHAGDGAQAWVGQLAFSQGRHAQGEAATALDSGCGGAPFATPNPGLAPPLPGAQ